MYSCSLIAPCAQDDDEEGVGEEKKGKGTEEASGKKSTLQQMIEGALMSASENRPAVSCIDDKGTRGPATSLNMRLHHDRTHVE